MCTLNRTAVGQARESMNTGQGSSARWTTFAKRAHPDSSVFMDHRVEHGDDGGYKVTTAITRL